MSTGDFVIVGVSVYGCAVQECVSECGNCGCVGTQLSGPV